MRALINSGVCSLQLAEDDLMEELSNQQVHGNAASALARKAYKEVKFLLSEHWDELEKLAQKLISNNEIHQDELTSLLGAVTSDSEVLDLIH
jgi:ATP-dependent Zn protease